jgi:hypothetical protein
VQKEATLNKRIIAIYFYIIFSAFSFAQQRDSLVRVGACATPGVAWGVFIQGAYAFVADVGGVTSIDISSPSSPYVLDFLNQSYCEASGIHVGDTLAFLNVPFLGPAFSIINISNPLSLLRLSWVNVPASGGQDPKGVCVIDSFAYLADGSAGFLIIDISDLLNPAILCTLDTPGRVIDLYVRDTLAYLADFDSLLIVNVSDPYNPTITGHVGIPGAGAYDVCVSGDYAFVTERDVWGGQGKVNMIDISEPTSPLLVEQISMAATPFGLFALNDKIYVAADDWWQPPKTIGEGRADIEGGIRVVHWEEPNSMSLLVSFDTPGQCYDVFVVDSFIYTAVWDSFMIYKYAGTGFAENDQEFFHTQSLMASPNPFNNQTKVIFTIPARSFVDADIYDVSGRRVRDLSQSYFVSGQHQIIWDGRSNDGIQVAAGVYFLRLDINNHRDIQKMVLIR